jgi:hypothetical protein
MLSKEQATLIADDLLTQEAQKIDQTKNRQAPAVHPFYRFSELSAIQPWQRKQIVNEASKLADRHLAVLFAGLIWVVTILSCAFFASPEQQGIRVFLAIVLGAVPLALLRRHYMHRYVVALCTKR